MEGVVPVYADDIDCHGIQKLEWGEFGTYTGIFMTSIFIGYIGVMIRGYGKGDCFVCIWFYNGMEEAYTDG
jgi:hypothetical protein